MSTAFERWAERVDAAAEQRWARIEQQKQGMRSERWSQWFSRSRLGRNVFYSRIDWLRGELIGEGWPDDGASMIMVPLHLSVAFADGGWFSRSQSYSFGIGGLDGQWIVGFAAMRYVCDLLGLVPPRRLKGELAVPDPDRLRAEMERQRREDREQLTERAKLLLTAETQYSYLPEAVFGLMGIERPRLGLDEADTALMLDAGAWEFLDRVGGVA